MAQVITNASVTINAIDLSTYIQKVTLKTSVAELETTSFGNTGKRRVGGLKDSSASFDFFQDFSASAVEATLYPLIGSTVAVVVKPAGTTVSTSNPSYTFNVLIKEHSIIDAKVGDLAMNSVSFPVDGTITKATV